MRKLKRTYRNRRRNKKGGTETETDIEMGPEVNIDFMSNIPADPSRLKKYEEDYIKESFRPISKEEASSAEIFSL